MEAGRVVSDRYELTERLGRGGMAEVFRATDRVLGREVALKVLLTHRAQDEAFVRRFEREARAAASLNHPHVVGAHDTGSDGDDHYIVMELVEGPTLEEVIAERSPLPTDEVVDISRQVCAGLAAAHDTGLVHRDIKPGNIMFDRSGTVKVTDFGIALATADATMTQTGVVYGSAPYLAPEQARGDDVDSRADLYSLGCVIYAMLVGEAPFSGTEPLSIVYQHLHAEVEPPSSRREGLAPGFDAVVLKLLAKDPEERYGEASQVREDLERIARGEPPLAADLGATRRMDPADDETRAMPAAAAGGGAPSGVAATVEEPTGDGGARPAWRKAGPVAVAAAVLAAILLALTMFSPDPGAEVATTPQVTSSPTPSPSPSPTTPMTVEEAVFSLFDVVNEGLRQGEMTQKAADELGKIGDEVLKAYRDGDLEKAVELLEEGRAEVSELTSKGEIEPERGQMVLAAIDRIEEALRRAMPPEDAEDAEDGGDDGESGDGDGGPPGGPPDGPPGEGRGRGGD